MLGVVEISSTTGRFGGHPQENFQKLNIISFKLKCSEIIFMTYGKRYIPSLLIHLYTIEFGLSFMCGRDVHSH